MAQYISKSALVAEMERRITAYQKNFDKADNKIAKLSTDGRIQGLKALLSFIDTLEVKEICVDFGDPKGDKSAKYIIDTNTLEVKEVGLKKELSYEDYIRFFLMSIKTFLLIGDLTKHGYLLNISLNLVLR